MAQHIVAAGGRHVVVGGGAHAGQRVTEGGGFGFRGQKTQGHVHEAFGREFAVTGHIPEGEPGHGAGQGIIETMQVGFGECLDSASKRILV